MCDGAHGWVCLIRAPRTDDTVLSLSFMSCPGQAILKYGFKTAYMRFRDHCTVVARHLMDLKLTSYQPAPAERGIWMNPERLLASPEQGNVSAVRFRLVQSDCSGDRVLGINHRARSRRVG